MSTAALRDFHVMAKPTGATCNLDCAYCFFLSKESLYPGSNFRMSHEVMESYIRQTIEARRGPEITIAWQGGEPTLMGLDFYRRAVEVASRYRNADDKIQHTIQTNGILLDRTWCQFLRHNNFLVGISIDGPRGLHDAYRRDKGGRGTFDRVVKAVHLMRDEGVEFNILCTVNALNSQDPVSVYRFFRDELRARHVQFIPIVERINDDGRTLLQQGSTVTDRSVKPEQYGRFLIEIFDEWVRRDVGKVFLHMVEGVLASWLYGRSSICIFSPECGGQVALEHNGDVYSCDHFVESLHLLGNILDTPLTDLVNSPRQHKFGEDKRGTLPRYCRECEFLFECQGECPKNRFITTPDGEPGLNYLCAGLKAYFRHVDSPMRIMSGLLRQGQPASRITCLTSGEETQVASPFGRVGRNAPCPCGSGSKYKKCHGVLPRTS
jgi:uncharacterized protein